MEYVIIIIVRTCTLTLASQRWDNMEIKVDNIHLQSSIEPKEKIDKTDDSFRFTLISNIEEKELKVRLESLMNDVTSQGNKIKEHVDVRDMKKYRSLIKDFMNEIANHSHEFSRENFLDRRGRHRVYGIIKQVDTNLDELASQLLAEEKDEISILNKVDEIRGLLLDLLV